MINNLKGSHTHAVFSRFIRIMKLINLFFIAGICFANAASSYSQSTLLTLEADNNTLEEVFKMIEKNSEYVFFYSDKAVNLKKKVSINVKDQTIDVDIWNYWHFAFTGSLVAIVTDNLTYGIIAAIINIIIVFVIADYTAPKAEEVLGMPGVSIPHGFSAAYVPFAIVINWVMDRIPGVNKIDINIEKLQKKFGVFGEPILIGTVLGIVIGALAGYDLKNILTSGIYLGAALVLIPKMASLLMEGLMPISEAAQAFISKRFSDRGKIYIGLDSAVGVGHPITLTVALILVPVAVFLAVILPGNTVLPMADLSCIPYMLVLIVPLVGGNGFRAIITGIIVLAGGLYISTDLAAVTTSVAHTVDAATYNGVTQISSICDGANPLTWVIYRAGNLSIVALAVVGVIALALAFLNRKRIIKAAHAEQN